MYGLAVGRKLCALQYLSISVIAWLMGVSVINWLVGICMG